MNNFGLSDLKIVIPAVMEELTDLLEEAEAEAASSIEGNIITVDQLQLIQTVGNYKTQLRVIPELFEMVKNGNWSEFSETVHARYEVMEVAFQYFYPLMPEQYRRDFVVGCYIHHGDSIPLCREALRNLPPNGINELPDDYKSLSELTVYRAGEEPIEEAGERMSWTLDKKMAVFFFKEYRNRHATYLYRAKIKPADVIAYTDQREEKEVIQYKGVYDIEVLDII